MINILGKIPHKVIIACSGGVDSMAVVDFLQAGGREVILAYFDHGTEHGSKARDFVKKYADRFSLPLHVGFFKCELEPGKSTEAEWRDARYVFFESVIEIYDDVPLITCHHLDDQIETWIFSAMHGKPKTIPAKRGRHIIRPFLLTKKKDFSDWARRKNVPFVTDPSNCDTKYMRNHIRHNIVPQAMIVNPGLHKTLYKKTKEAFLKQEVKA